MRYNAEKMTVGKYYSTPIFKFRMKCHLCDNKFEIQTDPKVCVCVCARAMCCHNPVLLVQNFDYVVVSGASRQDNVPKPKEGEMLSVEGEGTVGGDRGQGQGTRTGGGDKGAGTGRMCTD